MSPPRDSLSSGTPAPKIAIKGFSIYSRPTSTTTSKSKPPPSTLGKRSRTHFGHDDSDSDSDHVKHEIVTGFGHEGAIKKVEQKKAEPLVIPKLKNRDWRGEAQAKRGKNLLPPEVQAARKAAAEEREKNSNGETKREGIDVVNGNDSEIKWGLSVRKREKVEDQDASSDPTHSKIDPEAQQQEPAKEKTADEEALEALLGNKKVKHGPDLVIEAVSAPIPQISEDDAYRRAIATAPEASTLEDYERIPVEEFGAAMLRGMGWKGEANASDKARSNGREVKKRQNLLGLGAKELKDAEELGAWVQKADVKRLNSGADKKRDARPKLADYKRERDERRYKEGGYREERERERERERTRDRERDRDRSGYRERDRHSERDFRDRRR